MAVGSTAPASADIFQVTDRQIQIANRVDTLMTNMMKGVTSAVISPHGAIGAAQQSPHVRDTGVGLSIDFSA